ncbi:transcriptional regulator, TetR family [Microbispora rosea]|uniref:Transcriptional regulator, TetR family n=1 Tax=Microbispora rosea TaxID=58117 RepID=A0A1N7H5K7_9ACTN|nr:TetR/AcrR family transcriptional regulator [Microbispora rosea]GIH51766.1 transcriptional regulator [Microbispora rosea subsp. rosea]SIS20136.1 transcriptional regulator, TetR family [Microbispora rosea]
MAVRGPGKGSPRLTARGAATRERIVAAAADLMFRQGMAATPLDQVVDACGVSKSQLYHYFPDKDALIAEVIAMWEHLVVSAQKPQLDRVRSMRDLERWRDSLVSSLRERDLPYRCPIGSLASELSSRCDDARQSLAAVFRRWQGLLADGFTRIREGGELGPAAEPGELAVAVVAALQGGYLLAETMQDERPFLIAVDMALDHVKAHVRTPTADLTESDN